MQTLVRSMPDLHKTLILANARRSASDEWVVEELAMATEHAPFRHRNKVTVANAKVGTQRKKQKTEESNESAPATAANSVAPVIPCVVGDMGNNRREGENDPE